MNYFIILFFLLTLSGCTGQSIYRAAHNDGPGYKEIALSDNHYKIQFKIRGHARSTAQNYALRRAAELTLAQGYDWFLVENRTFRVINETETLVPTSRSVTTRQCGLLGCRTSSHNTPEQDFDIPDTQTLVLLNIRMGRGIRPEKETYDAVETLENLQKTTDNKR